LAPKVKFTREDVIRAAFDLVNEGGLRNLTALKVAQRLKSSVKPIYIHHKSMDNLKRDVFNRINLLMKKYTYHDYGEKLIFTNIAIGQLIFVWNYRNLYSALFSEHDPKFRDIVESSGVDSFQLIIRDPILKDEPRSKINGLYVHISHYVFGLCMTISNGWYDDGFYTLYHLVRGMSKACKVIYHGIFKTDIMGTVPSFVPDEIKFDLDDDSEISTDRIKQLERTIAELEKSATETIEA